MANETEDIVQGTHCILVFSLALLLLFGMPLLRIPLCNAKKHTHQNQNLATVRCTLELLEI